MCSGGHTPVPAEPLRTSFSQNCSFALLRAGLSHLCDLAHLWFPHTCPTCPASPKEPTGSRRRIGRRWRSERPTRRRSTSPPTRPPSSLRCAHLPHLAAREQGCVRESFAPGVHTCLGAEKVLLYLKKGFGDITHLSWAGVCRARCVQVQPPGVCMVPDVCM